MLLIISIKQVPMDELLKESDIISHVPLTDQTFHIVIEDFLRLMKPSFPNQYKSCL